VKDQVTKKKQTANRTKISTVDILECIKHCTTMETEGIKPRGHLKKTWWDVVSKRKWKDLLCLDRMQSLIERWQEK